jgi:hypothetical protein
MVGTRVNVTVLFDDSFEIDVGATGCRQARIESGSRFAAGFSDFICFEGTLDDVRNRTVFASGEPMRQVSRFGASHGKLRFGHVDFLLPILAFLLLPSRWL